MLSTLADIQQRVDWSELVEINAYFRGVVRKKAEPPCC